jgi:uncharacterized protein (TIGR02246 family)
VYAACKIRLPAEITNGTMRCNWHVLPLVLFLLSAGPLSAGIREDITAASDEARATVGKALADEDGGLLASIFTDDAVVISSRGQTIKGRSTIRASATLAFLTLGSGKLDLARQYLSIIDSTGYEAGRYVFRRGEGEELDPAFSGKYLVIWEIEDGAWKVARAVGL